MTCLTYSLKSLVAPGISLSRFSPLNNFIPTLLNNSGLSPEHSQTLVQKAPSINANLVVLPFIRQVVRLLFAKQLKLDDRRLVLAIAQESFVEVMLCLLGQASLFVQETESQRDL